MAGYSRAPLAQKLGIKPEHRVGLIDAPKTFEKTLGKVPPGVKLSTNLGRARFDVLVCFVTEQAKLENRFDSWVKHLDPSGGLWIAWPKRASGVVSDVSENTVRAVALAAGLVDNKVCAIDEVWSGLRCVVRLADRPKKR